MITAALAIVTVGIIPPHNESGFPAAGQFAAQKVGPVGGNAVAIAPRWALGCAHGGGGAYFVEGKQRFKIKRRIQHPKADLALWELSEPAKHYSEPLFLPFKGGMQGRTVTLVGFGGSGERFDYGYDGRLYTENVKRSATNVADEERRFNRFSSFDSQILVYDIDKPGSKDKGTLGGSATKQEGGIGMGDSGSPWFTMEGGKPRVVAISVYTLGHPKIKDKAYPWGAQGGGIHIYAYRDWIKKAFAGKL